MNRENIKLTAKIVASETQALYDLAKSKGINLPHPSLGVFKSILCEIEKTNDNGVRLGKKATINAVSTLIGCQINRNHLRAGNILGHIIDASINDNNEIEIACIFFKDIYEDEYAQAMDLFQENELTMSFELSADVQSQDKLPDGTKRLNDYYFTGAGLLFGVAPACKKARVFEMATKNLYNQLNIERQSLIFANSQKTKNSIMEILMKMTNKIEEIKAEEVLEVIEETKVEDVKLEEPKVEEVKAEEPQVEIPAEEIKVDESKVEEVQVAEPVAEAPIAEPVLETTIVEPVAEVKAEAEVVAETMNPEQPDMTPTTTVTEETNKQTVTADPASETLTVKEEKTMVITEDEQKQVEQTVTVETTYTMAQVEAIKAEYEQKLAAKDAEIVKIKETAEKLATRKIQLASNEFAKDFTDEDYLDDTKVENAKLKEDAKKEVVVANTEKVVLSTGHKKIDASDDDTNPLGKVLRSKRQNKR